ncbi:MAG: lipocalin family protein [Bifidobacteriaceae bacterium]|nr:lipocalin family protein [Bifidobacteriaceae bacterium]
MKKTALMLAAALLAGGAGLAGCASGTTTIDGTYRLTSIEQDGETATAEESGLDGAALTFTAESGGTSGTVTVSMGGGEAESEDQEATFTADGTTVTITAPEGEDTLECSWEGTKLTCTDEYSTMVFAKAAAQ